MSKKIKDIHFDKKNFNLGTDQGRNLLQQSISKFGFREAGVLDKNGKLVGGNKRTEVAGQLGINEIEIIKADPKKITLLQYDDIDLETTKGKELALALNQTALKNINIDNDLVLEEIGKEIAEFWDIESEIQEYNNDEDKKQKPEIKVYTEPYEKTHVLLSFHPHKMEEIKPYLDKIKEIEDIEIEINSN